MVERADLPLRDVLRFIIPGLIAAGYVEALAYLMAGRPLVAGHATAAYLLIALIAGVLSFAVRMHFLVPGWGAFLGAIRDRLAEITGEEMAGDEARAKPLYKIWLEAREGQPSLKSHLQYSTGVFYGLASLAVWSGALTIALLGISFWSKFDVLGLERLRLEAPAHYSWFALALAGLLTLVFALAARRAIRDLHAETLFSLSDPDVQREIREIFDWTQDARADG